VAPPQNAKVENMVTFGGFAT